MAVFKYKAITREKKSVAGLVEAVTEELAIDILKEKGLTIVAFREELGIGQGNIFSIFKRIKAKDLVIFSRQFSVLISASVTLVQSLHLLVAQTSNLKFKKIISEITDAVDGGARLSDAMAKYPRIFSDFYINVIKSGESSGKLDEVMNYLADELEKDYDMSSKIRGAMIYPAFVICGLGGVGAMMMIFVVPKLTAVIAETAGELPFATKMVIAVSNILSGYWWLILILLAGLMVGFKFFIRLYFAKRLVDTIKLYLPIFGKLYRLIYLVRFTRSLQTLIIGGVNISKALKITADIVNNEVYKNLIIETKKEVEDGNSISSVFINSKEIPNMVSQMMNIGEESGRLDMVLSKITDFYTREINNIVANLITLMEPIILVVMGVAVGIMVAAVIMPMYNMASQF